jgi:hypothetical protein
MKKFALNALLLLLCIAGAIVSFKLACRFSVELLILTALFGMGALGALCFMFEAFLGSDD